MDVSYRCVAGAANHPPTQRMRKSLCFDPAQPAPRTFRDGATSCVVILASAVLAACGHLPTTPLLLDGGRRVEATFTSGSLQPSVNFSRRAENPAPPVEYGGIMLEAAVVPVDTALDAGTMGLSIQVRAQNPSTETVTLPVRGCTVWPEFYDDPDRAGEPEWVPQGQCAQQPYEVVLAPGEEKIFHFLAYDVMLADGLEDGRYYVTAQFRHADKTIHLDAGSADVRLRLPNMAYHVQVEEHGGGGLSAQVRVENQNPGAVQLEFGACAVGFELYRNAEFAGNAIPLRTGMVCPAYLAIRKLEPGEVLEAPEFEHRVSDRATRGVPSGVYNLAVTLELNARIYRFPVGTVRVGG